jgi:hypothetical protein
MPTRFVPNYLFRKGRRFDAHQAFTNFQFRRKFSTCINGCQSPLPPPSSGQVSAYLSNVKPSISGTSSANGVTTATVPQTTETEGGCSTSVDGVGGSSENNNDNNNSRTNQSIRGEVLDLAADLRTFRPGDRLDIPYELTVSESIQEFWQSAFHSQDRINTSR